VKQISGTVLTSKPVDADDYDPNPLENVRIYQQGEDASPQNLELDLGSTATPMMQVGADEKIIVFVEGNLTIRGGTAGQNMANKITVSPDNGFLAFIVRGDITIESTVGTTDTKQIAPVIEGMYFANEELIIEDTSDATSDKKFIGRGSFIGLDGVTLQREFDSTADIFDSEKNSYSPVEQFIFSPSLVVATPNMLRKPDLKWQEIN
jgi:hypothetical protein